MGIKTSLSVIFITKNEEYHIGAAIDNVFGIAEEVFVVDSGSMDRTCEIAKEKGAVVLRHPFEGFGKQWNWALENCPVKSKWTMKLDPDERLSDQLKNEIEVRLNAVDAGDEVVGYSFDRVLWFMGCRLNGVRNEVLRIWRTGRCRFSDVLVNEHPLVEGNTQKLRYQMEHFDSRDLTQWLEKQNRYTRQEAEMRFRGDQLAATPRLFGNSLERRMWLKRLFYYCPMRYFLLDVYLLFLKGAWRTPIIGWRWVRCREMVMRLREYKYLEMKREAGDRHFESFSHS